MRKKEKEPYSEILNTYKVSKSAAITVLIGYLHYLTFNEQSHSVESFREYLEAVCEDGSCPYCESFCFWNGGDGCDEFQAGGFDNQKEQDDEN